MKPHGLRKLLWIANFVLAGVVLALGSWFWSEVRPATAKGAIRPASVPPAELDQLHKAHERDRIAGLQWQPDAPIGTDAFHKYVLRADYAKMVPPHWVFSGPLPSGKFAALVPAADAPDAPGGLESIGKVLAIYYAPRDETLVLFDFHESERNRPFGIGEFIRPDKAAPKRFRLDKVVHVKGPRYDLYYSVYGDERAAPLRTGILRVGEEAAKRRSTVITPVGEVATSPPVARHEKQRLPRSVVVTAHATRPNTFEVTLVASSYDGLRDKTAARFGKSIKTETAVDTETGRPYGLRIVGIRTEAAASAFQVRKGDVLISLNGRPVLSRSDALNILDTLGDDPIVEVVLERRGKLVTYLVDSSDPRERRRAAGLDLPK